MSHFAVLAIGENPKKQLKPFDENITMPKYVEFTKQQLIEKGKKEIEDYKNSIYARYIADKDEYIKNCKNKDHIKYLEEEFIKKLDWSDEEIYKEQLKRYDEENI